MPRKGEEAICFAPKNMMVITEDLRQNLYQTYSGEVPEETELIYQTL